MAIRVRDSWHATKESEERAKEKGDDGKPGAGPGGEIFAATCLTCRYRSHHRQ